MSASPTNELTNEQLVNAFDELGIFDITERKKVTRENQGELYLVTVTGGSRLWESDSVVIYESDKNYDECYDKIIRGMGEISPSWIKLVEQMYAQTTPLCSDKCKVIPSLKRLWRDGPEQGLNLKPEVLVKCEDDPSKMWVNLTYTHHRILMQVSYKIPVEDFERRHQIYDLFCQNVQSFNGVPDDECCEFMDHRNLGKNFTYIFDKFRYRSIHDMNLSVTESDDTDVVHLKYSFNVQERGGVTRTPTYETTCDKNLCFLQRLELLFAHMAQYIKDNYQSSWQRMFA